MKKNWSKKKKRQSYVSNNPQGDLAEQRAADWGLLSVRGQKEKMQIVTRHERPLQHSQMCQMVSVCAQNPVFRAETHLC